MKGSAGRLRIGRMEDLDEEISGSEYVRRSVMEKRFN